MSVWIMQKTIKIILIGTLAAYVAVFAYWFVDSGSLDYAKSQLEELFNPILKIGIISTLTTLTGLVIARVYNKVNKEMLKYQILKGFRDEINASRIKMLMKEVIRSGDPYPKFQRKQITSKEYRELKVGLKDYTEQFVSKEYYLSDADKVRQSQRLHKMIMNVVDTSMKRYRKAKVKIAKLKQEAERKRRKEAGEKVHRHFNKGEIKIISEE